MKNRSRAGFAFLLMFCICIAGRADPQETFRRYRVPTDGKLPPPPDREAILGQLASAGERLTQNPLGFTCSPLATKGERFSSRLRLDFAPPRQAGNDWERFKGDPAYRAFVENRETQGHPDLTPWFRELFSTDAQFTVGGWESMNRHLVAVVHSASGDRAAAISIDPTSGARARIIMRGYDAPNHFSSLQCWTESR